jgi:predicted deacylase
VSTIRIGDIEAEKGTKKFGYVEIGQTPTSPIVLPVGIINGLQPGRTLCITAGTHACEYAGIDAAIRIYRDTDPIDLSGSIIVVPVINMPAFEEATAYVCPIDSAGIAVPGNPRGTISQIIGYRLLEDVISKADFHIDLHGGDATEMEIPFAIYTKTANEEIDKKSETLARLFGTEYIWLAHLRKACGCIVEGWRYNLAYEAPLRGIPSAIGEAGEMGTYRDEDVSILLEGAKNVMKYLKIIDGEFTMPSKQTVFDKTFDVNTEHGGIFFPESRVGNRVSKGQVVGKILNLQGEIIEQIKAPVDGVFYNSWPKHVVNTGDLVFRGWMAKEL